MGFRVVIPARYGSTRLPGKPLLELAGRPMIEHVHGRAVEAGAAEVVVATDDERIAERVAGFGGDVCMTDPGHASGTERLAEVVAARGWAPDDIVVNVQGDEPLIPPALIRQVADDLAAHGDADVSTPVTRIHEAGELFDPHAVKVVTDAAGYALYFSRAAIPWDRDAFAVTIEHLPEANPHFRHIGLYAYRAGFVSRYVGMSASPLERLESLEQLRVLWHGHRIHVVEAVDTPGHGIDTPEDIERVAACLAPAQG